MPVVLEARASDPKAEFLNPVEFELRAILPKAELCRPEVLLLSEGILPHQSDLDPGGMAANVVDLAVRRLIAAEIAAGSSDEEIRTLFVASYGEQVLLDPPAGGWGIALWALPLLLGVIGAGAISRLRRKEPAAVEEGA